MNFGTITMYAYVYMSLLSVATVSVNMVVVLAFWRQRRLRTSPTNIYLTSLALCDLMTGLVVVPALTVTRYMDVELNQPPKVLTCQAIYVIATICVLSTAFHLFLVSADRYIKIKYDFFYIKNSTPELAYTLCAITYLINLIISTYLFVVEIDFAHGCDHPLFDKSRWYEVLLQFVPIVIGVTLPISMAVLLNIQVLNIAAERKRQIQNHNQNNQNYIDIEDNTVNCNQLLTLVIKEHKTALIVMTINVGYVVTWPLDVVVWVLFTYCLDYFNLHDYLQWKQLHPWLGLCNSVFNPIILFIMHSDYRQAIVNRVFACNKNNRNSV